MEQQEKQVSASLPKIIGFDGSTIRTECGSFTITQVIDADGGKSRRFKGKEFDIIRAALLGKYIEESGQTWLDLERLAFEDRHRYCYDGKHDAMCKARGSSSETRP